MIESAKGLKMFATVFLSVAFSFLVVGLMWKADRKLASGVKCLVTLEWADGRTTYCAVPEAGGLRFMSDKVRLDDGKGTVTDVYSCWLVSVRTSPWRDGYDLEAQEDADTVNERVDDDETKE